MSIGESGSTALDFECSNFIIFSFNWLFYDAFSIETVR
jgi:hypothetical protein